MPLNFQRPRKGQKNRIRVAMAFFDISENKRFLLASLGLFGVIVLVSTAVFFRVEVLSELGVSTFAEILGWQVLSWLPWFLIIGLGALPLGGAVRGQVRRWNLAAHLVAAVAVASASTLWFKLVSETVSPFLGLEHTRYGVFPWFFIFWFFFGLFLYWGSVNFFGLSGATQNPEPAAPGKPRLVVKTGRVSEVVKPENVLWIEAQDYYSVLHLAEKQSWIKMTMKELEAALDPGSFVRIHRSSIINVNHLKQIRTEASGKYSAVMRDGRVRPISRAGWRNLKKILKTTK